MLAACHILRVMGLDFLLLVLPCTGFLYLQDLQIIVILFMAYRPVLRHITADQLSLFTTIFLTLCRPTLIKFPSILQNHKSEIPHNSTSLGVTSDCHRKYNLLCPIHWTGMYFGRKSTGK